MSKREYRCLVFALFAALATLGFLEGGFRGMLESVARGVVGFVIGVALRNYI